MKEVIALLKGATRVSDVEQTLRKDYQDIKVASGHTKIVLINPNSDMVIKFWRRENVRYDYCTREAKIYQKAVKWGIQELFAPTVKGGYIDKKVPYYTQPKIEKFGYRLSRGDMAIHHPVVQRKVSAILENFGYYSCSCDWFAYVLKSYGEVTLIKLVRFLKDNKINDLRDENVGFKDGKPILIDYSGFHGGNRNRW